MCGARGNDDLGFAAVVTGDPFFGGNWGNAANGKAYISGS